MLRSPKERVIQTVSFGISELIITVPTFAFMTDTSGPDSLLVRMARSLNMVINNSRATQAMQFDVHLMIDGSYANCSAMTDKNTRKDLLTTLPQEMGMHTICEPVVAEVGANFRQKNAYRIFEILLIFGGLFCILCLNSF